jgi:hypothetical protein
MKNRKQFLSALSASGASLVLAATADRRVAVSASAAAPPPSAASVAIAATMRRFDPHLTDAELEAIARGIDENARAGAALNPKKRPLRNGDDLVVHFTVPTP